MLILTRKKDQGIVIDGNIEVFIVAVEGNKVRLGVKAPKDVSIVRRELLDAIKNENLSAKKIDLEIDFNDFKA